MCAPGFSGGYKVRPYKVNGGVGEGDGEPVPYDSIGGAVGGIGAENPSVSFADSSPTGEPTGVRGKFGIDY